MTRHLETGRRGIIAGLYALTPDIENTETLLMRVEQVLSGGARTLQYRNKSRNSALREEQAVALLRICRRYGVPFIINDDVDLACRIDADGAHLGREDGDLVRARQALGPQKLLGASCYRDVSLAARACEQGADHVAFGSFFPSNTKPGAIVCSPTILSEARGRLAVPIVAIGGITAQNAAVLISAGATAIAVISALFDAPDITNSTRTLVQLFEPRP